jgi:L,D-transpeptidase YcbB
MNVFMKIFLPVLFCIFLYVGCGNTTTEDVAVKIKTAKYDPKQPLTWDNVDNRNELIDAIKNAAKDGLLPEDYSYEKIVKTEKNFDTLEGKSLESYYTLLTKTFKKFTSHLLNGKIDPLEIYEEWEIKKNKINQDSLLSVALQNNMVLLTIENCKPKSYIYANLKKSLADLETYSKDVTKPIVTSEKIVPGYKSKTIILIKKRLQYWKDLPKKDTITPLYDDQMLEGVKKFQARHGLENDGKIGQGTIKALNTNLEKRKEQIIVNLERWRWYPRSLGTNYLAVNIPNYLLHTVLQKDTTKTYRVVVGSKERKTPVFSSKVSEIIFNPTWTVPETIIKEDLIPGTKKSRRYLTARDIVTFYKGKEISPANWQLSKAEDYKYVQNPGINNSLGLVKINFESKNSVYFHDTNHRDLFTKTYRALSSGCVRIEKPLPLAQYLLFDEENFSSQKIDTIILQKKTKIVPMAEDFKVHILYFTAWNEKGQLNFRDDVYSYDSDLLLRLTNQFRSNLVAPSGVVNK